eukprot:m.3316 g.3316  ORF g.3316 m.3316 type:complete len:124 (+) comp9253_c0_seq2:131-502(+)
MALLVGGATFVVFLVLFEYRGNLAIKKDSTGEKIRRKARKERKAIVRSISGDQESSSVADLAEIMVPLTREDRGEDTPLSSRFEPVIVTSSFIQFDDFDSELSDDDETQEILADSAPYEMKEN